MTGPIRSTGPGPAGAVADEAARLRKAAAEVEGVFMQQLFKAMRATVPAGGLFDGGTGEDMFTGMLDEHVANVAAARQKHGLGEALYRQLVNRLDAVDIMPDRDSGPAAGPDGGGRP